MILGAIYVGTAGALMHSVRVHFLAHQREAIQQLRGAFGEDNTRDMLGRAKRRRIIWGWVDSIAISGSDIDHVVVTRRGGIVVIDSKWHSDATQASITAAAAAANRSGRHATSVLRHLGYMKRETAARHRDQERALQVRPIVAMWGAARAQVPADAEVDGVRFIVGNDLVSWLATLGDSTINRASGRHLLRDMLKFRSTVGQTKTLT